MGVATVSYNGSGTFQINTSGQPVVAGTVISSTAFNALTADLATGLSTAITKDGQTTTTARIPFAAGINSSSATDSTSTSTGSIITSGGVGIAKALYVGTTANIASTTDSSSISTGSIVTAGGVGVAKNLYVGVNANIAGTLGVTGVATFSAAPIYSSLTASSAVATDASKALVSVTNTGTGNNVLATSPTLVTPVLGAASATSITVDAGAVGTPSITTTGDTNTGIFFPAADTIAFSEGGAEAMRIDSSGRVGIGTATPNEKLTVKAGTNQNFYIGPASSIANSVVIGTVNDALSANIPLEFRYGTTAAFLNGGNEAMRLDNGNNLQVGTTTRSNDEKFTVLQSANAMGISVRSTGGPTLGNYESADSTRASYWTFGRDNQVSGNYVFASGGTLRATIDTTGGLTLTGSTAVKATGTAWTNPSDQRLKDNIRNYAKGLTELMQIRVCEWEFNGKAGTVKGMKGLGVIADEVMTVLPNTVDNYDAKLNADDEETTAIKKFDATEITWLLVKTVQEQQTLIQSLTDRITALESK